LFSALKVCANLIQEKFIRRFDKKNIEAPVTQEDA